MNDIKNDITKYYLAIMKIAVDRLNADYFDVIEAIYKGGIREIIESDPEVSLHRDPEEWLENIEHYLKTHESVI